MNLLNPGLYYFSIYNQSNGDYAYLFGDKVSPSSEMTKELLNRGLSSRGDVTHLNEKWELTIQFSDESTYNTISGWSRDALYRIHMYKFGSIVQWREPVEVMVNELQQVDPESEDYPYSLRVTFIGRSPIIKDTINVMAPWAGVDNDPQWEITGASSTSYNATTGIQTINYTSGTDCLVEYDYWIGARDLGVRTEFDYRKTGGGVTIEQMPTSGTLELVSQLKDHTGSVIGTTNTTSIPSTGFYAMSNFNSANFPSNYRFSLRLTTTTDSGSFTFSKPFMKQALDLVQSGEFTNY